MTAGWEPCRDTGTTPSDKGALHTFIRRILYRASMIDVNAGPANPSISGHNGNSTRACVQSRRKEHQHRNGALHTVPIAI